MKTLFIIRGLPGSGKSTLATKLVEPTRIAEADMYFMKNGKYEFDITQIASAHSWCRNKVRQFMRESNLDCAVANTFVRRWEYEDYLNMAKESGFIPNIIECKSQWASLHGVPQSVMDSFRKKWQSHHES